MSVHDVDISIVCACRNEAAHIEAFVASILGQDMGRMNWEVVIADGLSTDGTREILDRCAAQNLRLRVLANPGRIVSTGLNSAIAASRGRILLRFDAHTNYAPDYCRRCVETLERTGAANVGGPARTQAVDVKARAIAAAYRSRFSTGGARFHDPNFEGYVDTVPYGCWRREVFEEIGYFDETLVRNQDDEFNLRLLRAGGKIWQSPSIVSWYSPRATLGALFHQYFQYGFWKLAVVRKHRVPGSWRHLVPAGFVLAHIVLLLVLALCVAFAAHQASAWIGALWLAMTGLYAFGISLASVLAAASAGWDTLPYLPPAFAAFHFSYGLGFLTALFRFVVQEERNLSANSVFARITR